MNPKEVSELLRTRRSIFPGNYTGEKVDDAIVEEMLENANWAPSNKRTEPWRFKVFTAAGLTTLAEFQSNLYKELAEKKGTFNEKTYNMLSTKPLKASHVIAIMMKRDEKESVPEVEEVEAVAMAVQNMYLTATAHGIGCYWGSGGITYLEEAKPFFGLGKTDQLLGFLFIGHPKATPETGKRNPIQDKVEWVRS
ncbi:MAG: nitroreductase [Cyclobacteriaceae bacterium]|nr:nitroreductase [Cyclobacteriaceae bacterium]